MRLVDDVERGFWPRAVVGSENYELYAAGVLLDTEELAIARRAVDDQPPARSAIAPVQPTVGPLPWELGVDLTVRRPLGAPSPRRGRTGRRT